ncbi:MAG: Fic family protein [Solirubrobacteraceae bacterium]|nr:Fic family protein [Solirubrobacteraceae bacterium]
MSDGEIVFTTRDDSDAWQRAIARGEARRIGRGIVTTNRSAPLDKVVRRNWSPIAAHYAPGATVVDRSFFDGGPADDGTLVLDVGPGGSRRTRPIEIPGLRIVIRVGPGPIAGDVPFTDGLHFSGQTRAYLDNLRPARARGGVRRTLSRPELEERLARILTTSGEPALGHLRDDARSLAQQLDAEQEAVELDRIIGSLFGTKDALLQSRAARAMRDGVAFDDRRIELFALLQQALLAQPPVQRLARPSDDPELLAFYESYFSNYIEGTRFTVSEAKMIVFDGVVPPTRPDDAHDIRSTYELIYPPEDHTRRPRTSDELIELLQQRHRILLAGRPDKNPGMLKEVNNQAGATVFVDWKLVRGTFREGFRFYLGLPEGLPRAIFIMFLIAEVHPFEDGNGRIARVFMNAELTASGQQRIIIPTGYRQNYLNALSGMTHNDHAGGLIRMLDFAHRYSIAIDWSTHDRAERMLRATGAFDEDPAAARIRLPEPWD